MPNFDDAFGSAPNLDDAFASAPDASGADAAFENAPNLDDAFASAPDEGAAQGGGAFAGFGSMVNKVKEDAAVAEENTLRRTYRPRAPTSMEEFQAANAFGQSGYAQPKGEDAVVQNVTDQSYGRAAASDVKRTVRAEAAKKWADKNERTAGIPMGIHAQDQLTPEQVETNSETFNAGLEYLQKNYGRPIARFGETVGGEGANTLLALNPITALPYAASNRLSKAVAPDADKNTGTLVGKRSNSWLAGADFAEATMTPEQIQAARARLPEWDLPLLGVVHPVEGGVELLGNPINMIPVGGAEALVADATGGVAKSILGKVAQFTVTHAIEGAAQGALASTIDPHMSVGSAALGGAVLAPVMGGAFKGAGALVKAKPVAVIAKELIPQFVNQLREQLSTLQFKEALPNVVTVTDEFGTTAVRATEPTSFVMTTAAVGADGKTTFRATAVQIQDGNAVRIAELPLNTPKDRAAFRSFLKTHDMPTVIHDPDVLARMSAEQGDAAVHELVRKPKARKSELSEEQIRAGIESGEYTFKATRLGSGEDALLQVEVHDRGGKVISVETRPDPVRGEPSRPPKEKLETPDPDAPPEAVNDEDIIVVSDGKTVQLKSPDSAQVSPTWEEAAILTAKPELPKPPERILKSTGNAPEKVGPDELAKAFPNAKAAVDRDVPSIATIQREKGVGYAEAARIQEQLKTDAQSTGARSSGSPPKGANESSARQPTGSEKAPTQGVRVEPIAGKKGWVRKMLPDGRVFEVTPHGEHRLVPANPEVDAFRAANAGNNVRSIGQDPLLEKARELRLQGRGISWSEFMVRLGVDEPRARALFDAVKDVPAGTKPKSNHRLMRDAVRGGEAANDSPRTTKNVKKGKNTPTKLLQKRSVTVEEGGPGTSVTVGNMTQESPHFDTPAKNAGVKGGEIPRLTEGGHGEPYHANNGDLNIPLMERPNQQLVKAREPGPTSERLLENELLPSGDKATVDLVEPGENFRYGEGDIGGGGGGGRGQWKSPGEPPIAEGPVVQPLPEFPDVWNGPLTEAQYKNLQMAKGAIQLAIRAKTAFKKTWNATLRTLLSPQHYGPPIKQEAARKLLGARAMFAPDETFRALEKRLVAAGVPEAAKPNSQFAKDLQAMAEGEMWGVYSSPIRNDEAVGTSRELLGKVRRQVVNEKYMMDHHPQAWTALKDMARDVMQRAEQNGAELAGLLGEAGEEYLTKLNQLRQDGLWELYVARMYRSHMLGKNWSESIPHEALNEGIEFLWHELQYLRNEGKSEYANKLRQIPEDELYSHAAKEVTDLIGMRDPVAAYSANVRTEGGTKPWAHLRTRNNEIPKPIQKLLGKETSGLIRLSHTLAVQDFMIHSIKVWNTLADEVGVSAPLKTLEHTVPVPDIPQRYGKMAGRWLRPEFGDLVSLGNAPEQVLQILRTVAAPFKFMNVIGGGLTTWTNNFYGNWWHAVLAGGLDPFRPGESGRAYSLAWHVLVNDRANGAGFASRAGAADKVPAALGSKQAPLEVVGKADQLNFWTGDMDNAEVGRAALREILQDPEAMAGILREARLFGVDSVGQMGVEVGGMKHGRISRALHQEMVKLGPNAGLTDLYRVSKEVIGRFRNATKDELSHTYDLIDRTSKLASYISLRQKFLREHKAKFGWTDWEGAGLPPQDAINYAANKAAKRIQDSYPDYRSMGKLPGTLADIPLLANPFIRFLMETVRIHATLLKRMARMDTEPDLMARMGFASAAAYTLTNGLAMMRRTQGISDEEADAVLNNYTARTGSFRPLCIVMPWRNADNEPAVLDLSQIWSPSVFFGGNREDATTQFANMNVGIKNVIYGVIHNSAGDLTQPAVDKLMNDAGMYRSFKDYQTLETDRNAMQWVEAIIKGYTIPRAITRPYDQYQQMTSTDPMQLGPRPTIDQMVGNAMGVPLVTGGGADSPAYVQSQLSDAASLSNAASDLGRSAAHGKEFSGDVERINNLAGTIQKRSEANEAAAKRRLFRK